MLRLMNSTGRLVVNRLLCPGPRHRGPESRTSSRICRRRFGQAGRFPGEKGILFKRPGGRIQKMASRTGSNHKSNWGWPDIVLSAMVLASLIGLAYVLSRH